MTPPAAQPRTHASAVIGQDLTPSETPEMTAPVAQVEFDRLARALAAVLMSWWKGRQQENAAVDQTAAAGEEVRDDATITRPSF
jgi:hypothetical protein